MGKNTRSGVRKWPPTVRRHAGQGWKDFGWIVKQPPCSPFISGGFCSKWIIYGRLQRSHARNSTPSIAGNAAGQTDSEMASQIVVKPSAEIILVNVSPVIPSARLSAAPVPPLQSQTQVILKTERTSQLIPISAIFSEGIKPAGVSVRLKVLHVLFDCLVQWN